MMGCDMFQLVGHQGLTVQARAWSQDSSCGIWGGEIITGTGFSLSASIFPCKYIPPVLHINISLSTSNSTQS